MWLRFFLLVSLILSSCDKKAQKQEKPIVLVSIAPYAYFVKKIADNAVDIETLVPAGADPHVYEAPPRQVERNQKAALWFYLGEAIDKRILLFFKDAHKPIKIIELTQGIELLSSCQEEPHKGHQCTMAADSYDLHIWLSPALAKIQARTIAKGLSDLLPEKKQEFAANLEIFLKELDRLDTQITQILKPFKGKAILVSHPAFGYFCQEYGLIQLSIETEGKEPLPQRITELLQQAKRYSVQSILIEPQHSNKGALLMAQALHLSTHVVDPLAENYEENLLEIARVIAQ